MYYEFIIKMITLLNHLFDLCNFLKNSEKFPPPWLIAMQRYGPPPSYPNLKIPGLSAAIPEVCTPYSVKAVKKSLAVV